MTYFKNNPHNIDPYADRKTMPELRPAGWSGPAWVVERNYGNDEEDFWSVYDILLFNPAAEYSAPYRVRRATLTMEE